MLAVYKHWREREILAATYTQMIEKNENIIYVCIYIWEEYIDV